MKGWRNIEKRSKAILSCLRPGILMVIFDVETTGLSDTAKIIQFSAVKYRINELLHLDVVDTLDIYINPETPVPKKITDITGITDDMLKDANTEKESVSQIYNFLKLSDVWAAYNVSFDLKMFNLMLDRTMTKRICDIPQIDILELARDLIPAKDIEDYKLSSVSSYLFPDKQFQFHSSLEDVYAASHVVVHYLNRYIDYCYDDTGKHIVYLKGARLFVNPRKQSQKRIVLTLNEGEPGDIYYDIVTKEWNCKSTNSAKRLFCSVNMMNLEEQFLRKYGYPFCRDTMDKISKSWMDFKKDKTT